MIPQPIAGWVAEHPSFGWAVNIALWLTDGMSPLSVALALATLYWTINRGLTERAKRRAIEAATAAQVRELLKE
jgi:hypothetical protein